MRSLLTALLLLSASAFAQGPGRAQFDAGVAAYRSGNAAGALKAFQAARADGYDTPQLHFNLGLCFYQLQRYPEARAQFEQLRANSEYAGVADFHLGLVAAREGDRARAEQLWRSMESGPDAALAQRAGVALARLEGDSRKPVATGYLLVAGGYDSNPALLDESLQPAAGGDSPDLELFGAFGWPLGGTARAATLLHGGAYLKDYTEDLGEDQRGAFAGLSRELDDGDRRLSLGLDASTSDLDGEHFLDAFTLQAQRMPAAGEGWRFSAQASLIQAPAVHAHLEGWRGRLGFGRAARFGRALARLGYELEYNDREDLRAGSEFFSQSPLRQRVELVVENPAGTNTTLRWNLRWRDSRYRDPDVTQQGVNLVEERRVETLTQAGLQLRHRLGRETFGLLEGQFSRNQATPDAYDYDRAIVLLGLEWVPVAK